MANKAQEWEVDWDLPFGLFQSRIKFICEDARQRGKVIPIPVHIVQGAAFMEQLSLLVAQVHCDNCTKCCITNPCGNPIEVMPVEGNILTRKYGTTNFVMRSGIWQIKVPCGFLNKEGKCSIYEERPAVCVIYPFQYGGAEEQNLLMALDSGCPRAGDIALRVFSTYYFIRKDFIRNNGKLPR